MPTFRRIPLAWLNLTHDPLRLLTSLAGIVFSVILMFMEYGFWNALMDSTAELIRKLDADDNDLIIISAEQAHAGSKGVVQPAPAVRGAAVRCDQGGLSDLHRGARLDLEEPRLGPGAEDPCPGVQPGRTGLPP